MGLFEDILVGAAAYVVASVVGASAVTAAVAGVVATVLFDDELWEKINKYLCQLREKIFKWLDEHQIFGAKFLRLSVITLDKARHFRNRWLKAEAVSSNGETIIISEQILSKEQLEEMGITEDVEQTVEIEELYG